jgi:hypothetical protein
MKSGVGMCFQQAYRLSLSPSLEDLLITSDVPSQASLKAHSERNWNLEYVCRRRSLFFPRETYYHISSRQDGQEAHLKKMEIWSMCRHINDNPLFCGGLVITSAIPQSRGASTSEENGNLEYVYWQINEHLVLWMTYHQICSQSTVKSCKHIWRKWISGICISSFYMDLTYLP